MIPHELTHLLVGQMTLNPFSGLPKWLAEGLAMYIEGPLDLIYTAYLYRAIAQNSLISVRSLASPFSAYAEEAALSYAQSHSLVEFLITNYGQSRMLELLNTFKQGSGYDEALEKVYGFDMDGLDILWRDSVETPSNKTSMKPMSPAHIETSASLYNLPVPALGLAINNGLAR